MILDKIAAYTRLRIEEAKKELSPDEIRRLALSCKTDTGFPFEKVLKEPGIHYICEVKKASPSKGVIAEDFPYLKIAERMAQAALNDEAVELIEQYDAILAMIDNPIEFDSDNDKSTKDEEPEKEQQRQGQEEQ